VLEQDLAHAGDSIRLESGSCGGKIMRYPPSRRYFSRAGLAGRR
jgi:hypothetical protein